MSATTSPNVKYEWGSFGPSRAAIPNTVLQDESESRYYAIRPREVKVVFRDMTGLSPDVYVRGTRVLKDGSQGMHSGGVVYSDDPFFRRNGLDVMPGWLRELVEIAVADRKHAIEGAAS